MTTHHNQNTVFHARGTIRTRNPSKLAAADPCLRQHGHRDRRQSICERIYTSRFGLNLRGEAVGPPALEAFGPLTLEAVGPPALEAVGLPALEAFGPPALEAVAPPP
jgi:hypothetical protein